MSQRIAFVGPFGFHPNKTMRSRALSLAKPLARRGYEIALFMPPWQTPAEADKTWQEDGVTIRYIPLRSGTLGITRQLIKETLAWQPDVVHCFKPKAYSGLTAWWLWQFHNNHIRLVVDTDDWEGWGGWNEIAPYSAAQKRFFAWQEQWGMCHNHALTVASRALQTIAWSMGITPERVVYLPNGPGIGKRNSVTGDRSGEPTVLVYSRLFEFDTGRLAQILRGVKTAVPELRILSVGAGLYDKDAANFQAQLAAAGLQDAFTDAGWVDEAELPAVLSQADVGIYLMADTLLNRTKCPVKLADMLSLGIPVVAEDVGQVAEYVVHGRTGLLRPPGDDDGLTTDLIHLLQNPGQRQTLAANAAAHIAQHFSWETLADSLQKIY
ncbi:MAG TPA: glycosyltransferase [Anaerolineae bacterium]|nr:glycosyltransferase [Anaerolineae bacterium]